MSTYEYAPLENPKQDIRLLTLLPGTPDKALTGTISHVSLVRPPAQAPQRKSLSELRETLPEGWRAYEILEGPYIFWDGRNDKYSWQHPSTGEDFQNSFLHVPPPGYEPCYEALSYTWGEPEPSVALYVATEGLSQSETEETLRQKLQIGPNLAGALRRLRRSDRYLVLWIDAVCINQDDKSERTSQVQRMTDVYELAHRVIVWLGESCSGSQTAVKTLCYAGAQVEVLSDDRMSSSPGATEPDWYRWEADLRFSAETWSAIADLLARSWFHRLWVLQEVQLANRRAMVYCGEDSISWPCLRRALLCLYCKKEVPSQAAQNRVRQVRGLVINQRDRSLSTLLADSHPRECTQMVDKVYGLLGLAAGGHAGSLVPDYTLSTSEAYRAAFFACLQDDGRLETLVFCEKRGRTIRGCPSWAPDWSCHPYVGDYRAQSAGGISRAHWQHIKPDTLRLTGKFCGIVSSVSPQAALGGDAEVAEVVRGWEPEGLRSEIYRGQESLLHAFVTVICGNILLDRFPSFGYPTLQQWTRTYLETSSGASNGLDITAIGKSEVLRCVEICRGRRFIVSDGGYIGLGPDGVQSGDFICVLLGFSAPMLLRPSLTRTGAFTIVGCAYVRGLEDASALIGPLPEHWSVKFDHLVESGQTMYYFNSSTGGKQLDDPRLQAFADDQDWERTRFVRERDDPALCARFRHKSNGEIRNSDPRLDPEALRARGVQLEEFDVI